MADVNASGEARTRTASAKNTVIIIVRKKHLTLGNIYEIDGQNAR